MRSLKELFELMLNHQNLFNTGICNWYYRLHSRELITWKEYWLIDDYIKNNFRKDGYAFPKGEIEPRIKWIKKQIKKL